MSTNPNPEVKRQLDEATQELARLKAAKAAAFPPNPHPFAQPDTFPDQYTPDQIARRNAMTAQIESLERRIDDLRDRLYRK